LKAGEQLSGYRAAVAPFGKSCVPYHPEFF